MIAYIIVIKINVLTAAGVLGHKSDIYKTIIKTQSNSVGELISVVKKIARILCVIGLIVVGIAGYFVYSKVAGDKNNDISSVAVTVQNQQPYQPARIAITTSSGLTRPTIADKKPDGLYRTNPCKLNVAFNTKPDVYLVTSYKGLQSSKYQFGVSGHEVKESEVIINKPGESLILVLMAYDPVLWKIKKTFGTKVNGVVLSGYHEQIMYGLSKTTPILQAIYETKTECSYFYDSLNPGGQKQYIEQRIREITGAFPTEIINSPHDGKFYVGSGELNPSLYGIFRQRLGFTIKSTIKRTRD